jgi:NAD(P)H-hydrate repair Nnr-like enzyme with NAD(P)H-hydrate epimerase domain
VIARYAIAWGIPTRVFAMRPPKEGTAAKKQWDRLGRVGCNPSIGDESGLAHALDEPSTVVVDALFGTGLRQPLSPDAIRWIAAVDRARGAIVSVDLPSGIDGDSGEAPSGGVHAARTLAIGALKPGLLTAVGAQHAGVIDVVPLPYPPLLARHLRRVGA